jgi:hypothetical protein
MAAGKRCVAPCAGRPTQRESGQGCRPAVTTGFLDPQRGLEGGACAGGIVPLEPEKPEPVK